MTDMPDSPHDPDIARALELEREREGPSEAARARVSLRLLQTLVPGALQPRELSHSPDPTATETSRSAARRIWVALRQAHPALTALVGFAVGVGVGAGVRLSTSAPSGPAPRVATRSAPSEQPVAPASPAVSPMPTPASAAPEPPAHPPPFTRFKAPSTSASDATSSAERVLLDVAYAALGRGEPVLALEQLQHHARRFPESALREEREALTIQCLHDLGRMDDVRRRATSFKQRYPNSLFARRVERALEEGPPRENNLPSTNP